MAGEIAIAVALVVASSLAAQSFRRLARDPLGVSPDRVGLLDLRLPAAKYADDRAQVRFYAAALPGVTAATFVSRQPVLNGSYQAFEVVGRPIAAGTRRPEAPLYVVSPDFCTVYGIPLRQGRLFSPHDCLGEPGVALVNQVFAEKFFPGENPLGRRFVPDLPPSVRGAAVPNRPWEIVGVTGNVKIGAYNGSGVPAFFLPLDQLPRNSGIIAVRTTGSPSAALRPLRDTLVDPDRDVLADNLTTMLDSIDQFQRGDRHRAWLLSGLAGLGLFLAALGVFGVVHQNVNQRTREIGIRLALGARPRDSAFRWRQLAGAPGWRANRSLAA